MTMTSTEICWDELLQLFPRILHLWRETPTHNNWAMEKLMELFCKHIARNPALVQTVRFPAFLEGFFDSGRLIQYPDFVVNNAALMVSEVLLSKSPELQNIEATAFALIRHPLHYWLVDKGHSAHVTFQIYSKFVKHRVMLQQLERFSFDASQAVAYTIASPHNYTRKSSSQYLIDLILFAFQNTDEDTDMKTKVRAEITECLELILGDLSKQHFKNTNGKECGDNLLSRSSKHKIDGDTKLRCCRLICDAAKTCPEWFQVITDQGIFLSVLDLCCQVAKSEGGSGDGLYISCAELFVQLSSSNSVAPDLSDKYHQLFLHLMKTLCQHVLASTVTEVLCIAQTVLVGQRDMKPDEKTLLLELCLLPLFVLVAAVPTSVREFSPEIVTKVQDALVSASTSKPLPIMKEAVRNLYSLLDSEIICSHKHREILRHLSFEVTERPSQLTRPLLIAKQLRDDQVVNFLEYSFLHLQDFKNRGQGYVGNILTVIESFMTYPRLSHVHIQGAMDCCMNLIKTPGFTNQDILLSLLRILQLKMVDLNPTIQEVAVKAAGDVLLSGKLDLTSPEVSQCVKALWQCVNYKTEGVATQVLVVLLQAASTGRLEDFLNSLSATKAEVTREAEKFLFSSNWDSIKPPAFRLLTKLCTEEDILKYAQTSFKRYNAELRVAVLDYMKALFEESYATGSSVEQQFEGVATLLTTGWGDLLLDKAISVETCNFRQVACIMEGLLSFMERKDVVEHVESVMSDLVSEKPLNDNSKGGPATLGRICDILMNVYGHLIKEQSEDSQKDCTLEENKCLTSPSSSEGESPAKKFKKENGVSQLMENRSELVSAKTQQFLDFALSGKIVGKNTCFQLTEQMCQENLNTIEDDYFDSTKELPPLILTNDPIPSRKVIHESLSTELGTEPEKVFKVVSWVVYEEILRRIQPATLSTEAERSTDEYERNCTMLLYDFHQVLDKSYKHMKEDLEEELVSLFLDNFSDILYQNEHVVVESTTDEIQTIRTLISCLRRVDLVLKNEDKFCSFVFDHRKSVRVEPKQMERSKFVLLDTFLDRLEALRCRDVKLILVEDMYPSKEGLGLLLDRYFQDQRETSSCYNGKDSGMDTECETVVSCVQGKSRTSQKQLSLDTVSQILHNSCKQFRPSGSTILDKLSMEELQHLSNIMSENDLRLQTSEETLKEILSSDKRKMFHDVLCFMKSLSKQVILGIFDSDSHIKYLGKKGSAGLFKQLHTWFLSEREFDSDEENDPTALDCF